MSLKQKIHQCRLCGCIHNCIDLYCRKDTFKDGLCPICEDTTTFKKSFMIASSSFLS